MLATALWTWPMKHAEAQQIAKVDAVLRMVDGALSAHRTLRTSIRAGRRRVDDMVEEVLSLDGEGPPT